MRPAYLSFEDLVKQYEQELWENERKIKQIDKHSDRNDAHQENATKDQAKEHYNFKDNIQ
ncbi:hypothetical protein GCM10028778_02020 [Barrientosiimonas marina]|uniref:FbpB family small basic protein n=1 Tax=Lentibacillus kimchii TaxID=1542911 RepID=A0ABW2USL8_9BACI